MGRVWVAEHLGLHTQVVVKLMAEEMEARPDGAERFAREAAACAAIKSPHVVQIFDHGLTAAGVPYIVMELLEGKDLGAYLAEKGRMEPALVLALVTQMGKALSKAHKASIVHRDIKPDNIFLHRSKEGEIVKVLDFGLAKLLDDAPAPSAQSLTVGTVLGTPTYMSPERLNDSPYDGQSDVYSTGILLYQMLTGTVPFQTREGDYWAVAIMHLTKAPPPLRIANPALSPEIEEVVLQSLAKDPAARPTAAKLAANFAAAVATQSAGGAQTG